MVRFVQRVIGTAALQGRFYEEVETDRRATGQGLFVVLLAAVAGGVGMPGVVAMGPQAVTVAVIAALAGWIAWAALTYVIGTHLLPEPQTRTDLGELLRTTAFASGPGIFRMLGGLPILGAPLYALASGWMLLAMVVAVRQALDFRSTGRAVAVCVVGWLLSFAIAAAIGILFGPRVS